MKSKLIIYDMNNWFRRMAERDVMGQPIRTCFTHINSCSHVQIGVWDGFKSLEVRRKIFPGYKVKRNKPGESFFETQKLFQELLEFTKMIQIKVPYFEGDDVVAALVHKYRDDFDVMIESNDGDLCQLGVPIARDKFPEEPHRIALYKTMVGDSSDNIPGAKGFGEKAWERLSDHQKDTLHQIVASGWALNDEEILAKVQDFYPKTALVWFMEKENRKLLGDFYKIVNFLPVPWDEIEKGMKVGINRPDLAEPIMKEFMI